MSDINLKIRHAKRQYSQNLDCSNMNLEYLPNELFNLKNLITLNLSNNKIKDLDKQIENLVNLKEINLENNEIEELPKEILNLTNLSKLNLKNNPILLKLNDFDIYWKTSLKSYFNDSNTKVNLISNDYIKTDAALFKKSTFSSSNLNQIGILNSNVSSKKNFENNSNFNLNESKLNNSNFSKNDFKNLSFANINVNNNANYNSNFNCLNTPQNFSGLLNNLNTSTKKQILKDGEVLIKLNKNSVKAFEEYESKLSNNNMNNKKSNEELNETTNSTIRPSLNNISMNKTFTNFNFSNKNSNSEINHIKEKEGISFKKEFSKNINSFQKISPVSLKPENFDNDDNSSLYNNRTSKTKNYDINNNKNLLDEISSNNISISQIKDNNPNNNSNIVNEEYKKIIEQKNKKIDELEILINEKDSIISNLNSKISDLDSKLSSNNINYNINANTSSILTANSTSGYKSNSFKFNSKPVEDEISQKRNWMDTNTSVLGGHGNMDNSLFIGNINSSDKSNEDFKELENKYQKEIMNNKRMKNQIDKLSQQIASMQNNFNHNSEDLLKSNFKY